MRAALSGSNELSDSPSVTRSNGGTVAYHTKLRVTILAPSLSAWFDDGFGSV
jgi:hypothetical protein